MLGHDAISALVDGGGLTREHRGCGVLRARPILHGCCRAGDLAIQAHKHLRPHRPSPYQRSFNQARWEAASFPVVSYVRKWQSLLVVN